MLDCSFRTTMSNIEGPAAPRGVEMMFNLFLTCPKCGWRPGGDTAVEARQCVDYSSTAAAPVEEVTPAKAA